MEMGMGIDGHRMMVMVGSLKFELAHPLFGVASVLLSFCLAFCVSGDG